MISPRDESEFVAWLDSLITDDAPRGEEALMLSRVLVGELGHPQRHVPAVHIVGTAGKGTVAALLTGRTAAAGIAVATHQSPHVYDVRERFLLDGQLPDWDDCIAAAESVAAAVDAVRVSHGRPPSYFAVTAALSWELGRREEADLFITEAGIGGRLDATAVLDRPDTLTVVTNIGLDHTDVLGSTIEGIAAQKAAVFSGRTVAVLGPQSSAKAAEVVRAAARRHGVVLDEVGDMSTDWRDDAAATAEAAARRLEEMLGVELPDGAALSHPPGRYEVIESGGRRVVLDGAHNPLKLAALARVVEEDIRPSCVIAAIGLSKDLAACGAALAAFGVPVVATQFGRSGRGPRSHSAIDLAGAVVAAGGRVEARALHRDAATRAHELSTLGETILVTGSFMILADLKAPLRGRG